MGNSMIGGLGRKRVKVMKINGETLKLRVPLQARDVTKDHPGHVLLDSEAVKHFGVRAKPLDPHHNLKPKKIYFLIELPKFATEDHRRLDRDDHPRVLTGRRVQSGINMSAKDRLECLMLARRSASDLTLVRPAPAAESGGGPSRESPAGPVRVRMRLPRAEVARLVEESKDEVEVAQKIIGIYMRSNNNSENGSVINGRGGDGDVAEMRKFSGGALAAEKTSKAREKRVSFLPIEEGEIRLAVDTLS